MVTILPAVILGSWLWQSAALAYVYYSKGPFLRVSSSTWVPGACSLLW